MAGSYTLRVSDKKGVYADSTTTFTLYSDEMPAEYSQGRISAKSTADKSEFENFLKNISGVEVNGKVNSASPSNIIIEL
ncbi:MAG: hypothetical protein ACI4DP_09960 [Candidatus Ornithomonoglobus sp.]